MFTDNNEFDIREEVDITKIAIDDPKEQAILEAHIKQAKASLRQSNESPNTDIEKTINDIKVRFNMVLSKLYSISTTYDDLITRLDVEGDKPVKRAEILTNWEPVNIELFSATKELQKIYTEWTTITAFQLNK